MARRAAGGGMNHTSVGLRSDVIRRDVAGVIYLAWQPLPASPQTWEFVYARSNGMYWWSSPSRNCLRDYPFARTSWKSANNFRKRSASMLLECRTMPVATSMSTSEGGTKVESLMRTMVAHAMGSMPAPNL